MVDTGEPSPPQITRAERQARIDELGEAAAYKKLQEMQVDAGPKSHFLEKHGAQTTLQSQFERASTGKNPTTGIIETYSSGKKKGQPITPNSTRYVSHRDQLNAINRAVLTLKQTGRPPLAEKPVDMGKKIGEGYEKGTLKYGQQTKAVTYFDKSENPITSFPEY